MACSALASPNGAQRSFLPTSRYSTGLPIESRPPEEGSSHGAPSEARDGVGWSSTLPMGTWTKPYRTSIFTR
eukprot:1129855-Prymnesium_polylepis.1